MFKRILGESLHYVANNPMIVRIAFLTGFAESVVIFYRFAYFFYFFLEKNFDISNLQGNLGEYGMAIFNAVIDNVSIGLGIFLIIFAIFWYVILFPIGRGMMINYLETASTTKSLTRTIRRYFIITITQGILAVITFGSRHLRALRYLYYRDAFGNIIIQILAVLIGGMIVVTTFLYPYATVSSVLDTFDQKNPEKQAWDALSYSARVALAHPRITIKFLILSLVLLTRFFITSAIVIGIPTLLIRVLLQIGLLGTGSVVGVVVATVGIFLIASIYINAVVDAIMMTFRYKLYTELKDTTVS